MCSLLAVAVGLIAMRIGFWRKSLVATVVAAIILITPFGNVVSLSSQHSFSIYLIGVVVILILGLLIFIEISSKVNKMEAV